MAGAQLAAVPNTYDQPRQDQRQKVVSFNIAPAWQHTLGAQALIERQCVSFAAIGSITIQPRSV